VALLTGPTAKGDTTGTSYTSREKDEAPSQQQVQAKYLRSETDKPKERPHHHQERVTEVAATIGE
jgi:hypothetical protein